MKKLVLQPEWLMGESEWALMCRKMVNEGKAILETAPPPKDSIGRRKNTHCPNGHKRTPESTFRQPSGRMGCTYCAKATSARARDRHNSRELQEQKGDRNALKPF